MTYSKKDFVSFVYKLSQDFDQNPDAWQNKDLGSFLEALAAWVDDMEGYYLNQGQQVPDKPDWQMIADMFMAAKIYE
jgi:hypothetical protein